MVLLTFCSNFDVSEPPLRRHLQKMDPSVDKMKLKLTKYGFRLNLLGSSSFLSVLGIIVSIIGVIGSIACFVFGWIAARNGRRGLGGFASVILYVTGAVILIIMVPYLIMWILLKIKTSKQDVPGIERIGKIYSYVSGSLEIIAMIARIILSIRTLNLLAGWPATYLIVDIVFIIGAAIYLAFACLKIHGVRVENNKLVGTYLGFRYGLFVLHMIGFIILSIISRHFDISIFVVGIHFILDIGLTVILHSIRVDRENTAGTETVMKNF